MQDLICRQKNVWVCRELYCLLLRGLHVIRFFLQMYTCAVSRWGVSMTLAMISSPTCVVDIGDQYGVNYVIDNNNKFVANVGDTARKN